MKYLIFATVLFTAMPAWADESKPSATSASIEVTPEFDAQEGDYVGWYIKPGIAHTFSNGLVWGGSVQFTDRVGGQDNYIQGETTLGYALKLNPAVSVPVSAGLGFRHDQNDAAEPDQDFAYYVFSTGLNIKFSPVWTWNMVSVRYRNTFEGNWETPKAATGVTYALDKGRSIYTNVWHDWKNGERDKMGVSAGYKVAF